MEERDAIIVIPVGTAVKTATLAPETSRCRLPGGGGQRRLDSNWPAGPASRDTSRRSSRHGCLAVDRRVPSRPRRLGDVVPGSPTVESGSLPRRRGPATRIPGLDCAGRDQQCPASATPGPKWQAQSKPEVRQKDEAQGLQSPGLRGKRLRLTARGQGDGAMSRAGGTAEAILANAA